MKVSGVGEDRDTERALAYAKGDLSIDDRIAVSIVATRLFGKPVRVGRYEIVRRVGAGGMGVVYEAVDPELGRRVALKVLRASGIASGGAAALRDEARAMARLSDPHIVQVLDLGLHSGHGWLAMEFVEGATLAQWGSMPHHWSDVARVGGQVASGLAAIHDAAIVHGDVKPSNILIDHHGRPRVTDFGFAQATMVGSNPREAPGPGGGTPAFMAPEQEGRGAKASAATDQYALCVVLQQLIDGGGPHNFKAARGQAPLRLRAVIRRGRSPDPGRRWPDASALANALADTLGAGRQRRRVRAVMVGVAVAATVAAATSWSHGGTSRCAVVLDPARESWAPMRDELRQRAAQLDPDVGSAAWRHVDDSVARFSARWVVARANACATSAPSRAACLDRTHHALVGQLSALDSVGVVQRWWDIAAELPDPGACSEREADLAPDLGWAWQRVGRANALARAGHDAEALELLESQAAQRHRPGALARAVTLARARLYARRHELGTSRSLGQAAYLDAVGAGDDQAAVEAALILLDLEGVRRRDPDASAFWARAAAAALERARVGTDTEVRLWAVSGFAFVEAGRFEDAAQAVKRAQSHAEDATPRTRMLLAQAQATIAFRTEELERALAHAKTSLALAQEIYPSAHPHHGTALLLVGAALLELGRHDEARRRLEDAFRVFERHDSYVAELAMISSNLGNVHTLTGDREAAARWYQTALSYVERQPEPGPTHVDVRINLGTLASDSGDLVEAKRQFELALDAAATVYAADHFFAGWSWLLLALNAERRGDREEAARAVNRAHEILDSGTAPPALRSQAAAAWARLAT